MPPDTIALLQQAARAGADSDDTALRWLAAGIARALAGDTRTLDAALGLNTSQSQRHWQTIYGMARRDAFIHHAGAFFEGTDTAKARAIAAALRTYADRRWRQDRSLVAMPATYRGHIEEVLYLAMAASEGRSPPGPKQVLRILRKRDISTAISCPESGGNLIRTKRGD